MLGNDEETTHILILKTVPFFWYPWGVKILVVSGKNSTQVIQSPARLHNTKKVQVTGVEEVPLDEGLSMTWRSPRESLRELFVLIWLLGEPEAASAGAVGLCRVEKSK